MNPLISTRLRRLGWALLAFMLVVGFSIWDMRADPAATQTLTLGDFMTRLLVLPSLLAISVLALTSACATPPAAATAAPAVAAEPPKPFVAQVVGLQWLNPLQRRDYPTEWQLLWTLGLVQPNKNDDMVKAEPKLFSTLQSIGVIATTSTENGRPSFDGYHEKYVDEITLFFRQNYFSNPNYFYTVSPKDKKQWRELAGIHVEYALPEGKLDPVEAGAFLVKEIKSTYDIGNTHFPSLWTRDTDRKSVV